MVDGVEYTYQLFTTQEEARANGYTVVSKSKCCMCCKGMVDEPFRCVRFKTNKPAIRSKKLPIKYSYNIVDITHGIDGTKYDFVYNDVSDTCCIGGSGYTTQVTNEKHKEYQLHIR